MNEYWVDFRGSLRIKAETAQEAGEKASLLLDKKGIEYPDIEYIDYIGECENNAATGN